MMIRRTARHLSVFLVIALCLPTLGVAGAFAQNTNHTLTRPVGVFDTSRIVSIGGAVTEILYALDMGKNIVGIDTTSLYPPRAASEKASVGYMRQLSAEGVLGLSPTLILAVENSGPKDVVAVLQAAHVPFVVVHDSYSEQGIVDKIRLIAEVIGARERAQCMIESVQNDFAALDNIKTQIAQKKRVLFILSFVNGRAMVAGKNTAADGIIRLAGGENAIDAYEGYKPITDEAVIAAGPDVVLTMQRGGPGTLDADRVFSHAAFSAIPAAADKAFIAMDGLYLLGFGPRTAQAARDLAGALYPQISFAALSSQHVSARGRECRQ